MNRTYVPFDESWGMPIDVTVSRAVRCGDVMFTCGQVDLDAEGTPQRQGDLGGQTARAMGYLYDVLREGGAAPADMLSLHVFYLNDGGCDEAAYRREIAGLIRGKRPPVLTLTPLPEFFYPGVEVEIDAAAAVSDGATSATAPAGDGFPAGSRRGGLICATVHPRYEAGALCSPDDVRAQTDEAVRELETTLDALGADFDDVCKLTVYTTAANETGFAETTASLASRFHSPGPACTLLPLPRLGAPGECIRIEAMAVRGAKEEQLPRQTANVGGLPAPPGPFSHALKCGEWLFIGAQLPLDAGGVLVQAGDLAGQTHTVMQRVGGLLESFGADFRHVLKVNTWYAGAGPDDLHTNLGIRNSYYVRPGPASTGMQLPRLWPDGALISIDVVASTAPL